MRKPKILLVSDSAFIDSGFGRVAREIGTGLMKTGRYEVTQLGWFHNSNDRMVPFRVIPTDRSTREAAVADQYSELTYPRVISEVKPDVVIAIGDQWMVKHLAVGVRNYKLIAYVPIDSAPMLPSWGESFLLFDQFVAFGKFGESVAHRASPDLDIIKIPHGVDTNVFKPISDEERTATRIKISPTAEFIVGCTARNNARKNLPRLLKAFRRFLNAASTCNTCGNVEFKNSTSCPACGGTDIYYSAEKVNTLLYLHSNMSDPAGHDLLALIKRFGLSGYVGVPEGMTTCHGVPDEELNALYNAMDVFTLPTKAEGWGLPICEAMSAGVPVLVTDYSGHVEFVQGAGELIRVAEFETAQHSHGEFAIVDLNDYVCKLDRFFYESTEYIAKWGPHLKAGGVSEELLKSVLCGKELRTEMGKAARERALKYDWQPIIGYWSSLIDRMLGITPDMEISNDSSIEIEVLS